MSCKEGWELETLSELCSLWRSGEYEYSREFLADTICTDLARQRRFGGDKAGVKEALELLSADPSLGRSVLENILAKELFNAVLGFVRKILHRGFREGDLEYEYDLADEGHRLLCDFDSFNLLFTTLSGAQLSVSGYLKLAKEKMWLFLTTLIIKRYFYVFWNASLMVDDYCRYWKVESNSPLMAVSIIAELSEGISYEEFKNSL